MKKRKDFAFPFRVLIGFLLFSIVAITILQVVSRFVFDSPLVWSDELGRFLLIWMVFIGAAIVSYDDKHLGVEMLQEKMSHKTKLITTLIMRVVILAALIITAYSSFELVQVSHSQTSGALEIPFSFWRGAATVGAVLMIIAIIIRTIFDIIDYRNGEYRNSSLIEEEVKE